jgi:hypothetical protein
MSNPQSPVMESLNKTDIYLKIWEIEQKHTSTRWTVAIFFLNVSFIVFGLSYQPQQNPVSRWVLQLAALGIYWFAIAMLERFSRFTAVLRDYLYDMESSKQTTLEIQSKSNDYMRKSKIIPDARRLMRGFGILYTILVITLRILGLTRMISGI